MPTEPLPFFNGAALRQQFIAGLERLRAAKALDDAEQNALIDLMDSPHDASRGRYDRFEAGPDAELDARLLGGLLVGLASAPQVYLFTPALGVRRYPSRPAFLEGLAHLGINSQGLALELVERRPYEAQMKQYLERRSAALRYAADRLALLPRMSDSLAMPREEPALALVRQLDAFWQAGSAQRKSEAVLQALYIQGFYQDLAAARWSGALSCDAALLEVFPKAPAIEWANLFLVDGRDQVPFAGALVWYLGNQPERCLYLPEQGLACYSSEQAMFSAIAGREAAPLALPLKRRGTWSSNRARLALKPVLDDPFRGAIAQIRAVQGEDAYAALDAGIDAVSEAELPVLEQALDVRQRLDRRLARLDPDARWSAGIPVPLMLAPTMTAVPETDGEVIALLAQVRDSREALRLSQPGIAHVLDQALQPWLALFGDTLTAEQVRVTGADPQNPQARSLADLLLERFTGRLPVPLPAGTAITFPAGVAANGLDRHTLELCLAATASDFSRHYQAHLERLFHNHHKVNGLCVKASDLSRQTLEWVLRVDLALATRNKALPNSALALLSAALEGTGDLEVFGIDLALGDPGQSIRLPNVAAIGPRPSKVNGADEPGPILLWSAAAGLQSAASLEELSDQITRTVSDWNLNGAWLASLPLTERNRLERWHEANPSGRLVPTYWPMEGGLLHRLQKSAHGRRLGESAQIIRLLCLRHYGAPVSRVLLDGVALDDDLSPALARQAQQWVDRQADAVLPAWIRTAPTADLQRLQAYMKDCAEVALPEQDYLQGLPTLERFAADALRQRLNEDGITPSFDPEQVRITSRAYIPAPVAIGNLPSAIPAAVSIHQQNLTQALLQPTAWLRETMSLSRDDGGTLPPALTPLYVRTLVRSLDCGGGYRRLLERTLGPEHPSFSWRRDRFIQQLRRQMLMSAFALKLQGGLSSPGFALVEQLAQAPDAQARADAGWGPLVLSALKVSAGPSETADRLRGAYVLESGGPGPVVLFLLYARQAGFVEFASAPHLDEALRSDQSLQAALLDHVARERRQVYADGGFTHPHLNLILPELITDIFAPVAPAQWSTEPITGNAFHRFYEDNLQLLRDMASAQTVTAQEARWQDFRYLISLAIEQGSLFLPVPLAVAIGAWQSGQLAKAAVVAAQERKWGQALSEIVAAMANLISLARPSTSIEPGQSIHAWEPGSSLGALLRRRVAAMEVTDVALENLQAQPALSLYRRNADCYASVEGKVFRVASREETWHILDKDGGWGPSIKLNPQGRWVLDQHLPGGGPVVSRLRHDQVVDGLEEMFSITENGLREIRRFKPNYAIQIESSLVESQRMLHRAERKLASPLTISEPTRHILEDTFGPGEATADLIGRLHGMVEAVLAEAIATSLRDGDRWVLCKAITRSDPTVAFVVDTDNKRRVFLTDAFFDPATVTPVSPQALQAGFDPLRYLQSTVLIHELSHWSLGTEDFTYLGLAHPYFDLIEPSVWRLLQGLIQAERRGLAYDTPANQLFGWLAGANPTQSAPLRRLLTLTGQPDLAGAINAYQSNAAIRNEVILRNADSLAWLVLQLGREPLPAGR